MSIRSHRLVPVNASDTDFALRIATDAGGEDVGVVVPGTVVGG